FQRLASGGAYSWMWLWCRYVDIKATSTTRLVAGAAPPWRRARPVAGPAWPGLLLDVEEALVHELVDAQGAELAAEAGALGAAEGQVRALAGRGVDVGHADLELLGDLGRAVHVGRPHRAAEAEVHDVGELDRLVVAADLVDDGDRAEQFLLVGAHVRGDAGQHGRREVRAALGEGAADVQGRA